MKFKNILSTLLASLFLVALVALLIELHAGKFFWNLYTNDGLDQKPKIVIIGDSFGASSFSFPQVLGKQLKNSHQVINLSESGFGPDHYLMYVRLVLKRLKPEVCIVSFNAGNDILDIRSSLEENKIKLGSSFFSYHLLRRLYAHLKYRAFRPEISRDAENIDEAEESELLNPLMKVAAAKNPDIVMRNLTVSGADVNQGWRNFKTILKELNKTSIEEKIPLVIMIIPNSMQVSDFYQKTYKAAGYKIPGKTDNLTGIQDKILDITTALDMKTIDFLPLLKQHDKNNLHFHNDPHLNKDGHKLLTEYLLKYLNENKLITSKD